MMPGLLIRRFGGLVTDAPAGDLAPGQATDGDNYRLTRTGAQGERALQTSWGRRRVWPQSLASLSSERAIGLYLAPRADVEALDGVALLGIDHGSGGRGVLAALHQDVGRDVTEIVREWGAARYLSLRESFGAAAAFDVDTPALDAAGDSEFPDVAVGTPARVVMGGMRQAVDGNRSADAAVLLAGLSELACHPYAIAFGEVQAQGPTARKTLTVRVANESLIEKSAPTFEFEGDDALAFTVSDYAWSGETLSWLEAREIDITFGAPATEETEYAATLRARFPGEAWRTVATLSATAIPMGG